MADLLEEAEAGPDTVERPGGVEERALGYLGAQSVKISFWESNGAGWKTAASWVQAPVGWQRAMVALSGWDLAFRDGNSSSDHELGHVGVGVGFGELQAEQVQVTATVICRDKNGDDAWRGTAKGSVVFFG